MILLPGNNKRFKEKVAHEPTRWGWLFSQRRPLAKTLVQIPNSRWAYDNDCFNLADEFDPRKYINLLKKSSKFNLQCLFVTAPDVVGDARTTLSQFEEWTCIIRSLGLRVALVAQDGLEDLEIPWTKLDTIFVGGTTHWKLSSFVRDLIEEGRKRKKWIHVGRVNSIKRMTYFMNLKADSVDGTEWAINPARGLKWATMVFLMHERQLRMDGFE